MYTYTANNCLIDMITMCCMMYDVTTCHDDVYTSLKQFIFKKIFSLFNHKDIEMNTRLDYNYYFK